MANENIDYRVRASNVERQIVDISKKFKEIVAKANGQENPFATYTININKVASTTAMEQFYKHLLNSCKKTPDNFKQCNDLNQKGLYRVEKSNGKDVELGMKKADQNQLYHEVADYIKSGGSIVDRALITYEDNANGVTFDVVNRNIKSALDSLISVDNTMSDPTLNQLVKEFTSLYKGVVAEFKSQTVHTETVKSDQPLYAYDDQFPQSAEALKDIWSSGNGAKASTGVSLYQAGQNGLVVAYPMLHTTTNTESTEAIQNLYTIAMAHVRSAVNTWQLQYVKATMPYLVDQLCVYTRDIATTYEASTSETKTKQNAEKVVKNFNTIFKITIADSDVGSKIQDAFDKILHGVELVTGTINQYNYNVALEGIQSILEMFHNNQLHHQFDQTSTIGEMCPDLIKHYNAVYNTNQIGYEPSIAQHAEQACPVGE